MKAIEALIGWEVTDGPHHWRTPDGELRCNATVYDLIDYLKGIGGRPFDILEATIRLHHRQQAGEFDE